MEEKRLKQFTFYDLYYEALKGLPDEAAGRMAKNICRFMFTNEEIPEPQMMQKWNTRRQNWDESMQVAVELSLIFRQLTVWM